MYTTKLMVKMQFFRCSCVSIVMHLVYMVFVKSQIHNMYTKTTETTQQNCHEAAKPGYFSCAYCCKSFKTKDDLTKHQKATGHLVDEDKNVKSLQESIASDTGLERTHTPQKTETNRQKRISEEDDGIPESNKARRQYISTLLNENITIERMEKKTSVAQVTHIVRDIIDKVRRQEGGKMYSSDVRRAGSYNDKTKISYADEFDFIVELKVCVKNIRTGGPLNYIYSDKENEKKFGRPVSRLLDGSRILTDIAFKPREIPLGHVSLEACAETPISLTFQGDLIPHKILEHLYSAIKGVTLTQADVKILPTSQGPALTITINDGIDVDLVPSLLCPKLSVDMYGWPRKNTRKAYKQEKIKEVVEAGLHLVPKGDETWTISFSKAENALLDKIDDGNECRREIMKILKYYLQECKKESENDLPGLSSHIIKVQILWSSENRREKGSWQQKFKDICLINTMQELEESLRSGSLPYYFNTNLDVLKDKERNELEYFAKYLSQKREEIEKKGQ